jgi:Short C-terminal domain
MQRHHYRYRGGPFLRRPGLPPFGRSGLLGNLIVGGLGYLIGHQQVQNQYQQRQSQANSQSDQLAQLRLLGQLRESGVLTEEEFQEQKQKILRQS